MRQYYLWFIAVCIFASGANADNYVEWVGPNSGINWTEGAAIAAGAGIAKEGTPPSLSKMQACRAAVVDAQRNLVESLQGVRVEGITRIEDLMLESDVVQSSVEGTLKGAVMTERKPQPDGTCEVTLRAPLAGNLASSVYDEVFEAEGAAFLQLPQVIDVEAWVAGLLDLMVPTALANAGAPWQSAIDQLGSRLDKIEVMLGQRSTPIAQDTSPTGLVIDARGSNFIPSMSPAIRQLRAGILYPTSKTKQAASERGQLVSLFTRDLETAKAHPIVGERPVVFKALRTWGDTRTSIVLNTASSERLSRMIKEGQLEDAGVIIVL
jgi:hypothetical protein